MFRLLPILLVFFALNSGAAPLKTTINGHVPAAAHKWVRLYSYSNFVTLQPARLAKDSIGSSGNFQFVLQLEPKQVLTVFFAVEKYKSFDFYVEAGKTYTLTFDSLDYDSQDDLYSPLTTSNATLNFHLPPDSSEINQLIYRLTIELIQFSVNEFAEMVQLRNFKKMEVFKNRIDSLFAKYQNDFLNTMAEYSIADLELSARMKSNPWFVNTYFNNKPFLYDNPAFMAFFNVFFDKYIYTTSTKIPLRDLKLHIVTQRNYAALLDSLGKDTLLKNEVIRDMVLIKNLTQMYYSGYFVRDSIFNLMTDISNQSKFPKHREIAADICKNMTLHFKKIKAPPLQLRLVDASPFSLEQYKGEFVYVLFFTTNCRMCMPEFQVLESIVQKYSSQMNFLAVSMDINFLRFYYFMQDHHYSWDFANFARNFDVEDQWNVKIYPHAFVIDDEGYIINTMAPLPSENLDAYLKGIFTVPQVKPGQ